MKHVTLPLALALSVPALGCARDDEGLRDRVDDLSERVDDLEHGAVPPKEDTATVKPKRADSREIFAVPVEGNPSEGPEHARVTIVEAYEYACPYCMRAKATIDQLEEEYGDDIRIVYKSYVVHPDIATTPALAACAANEQGKFSEMNELIWTKGFEANRDLGRDNMLALAEEAGLDLARFAADMDGEACKSTMKADRELLRGLGVRGTPAFFINGHLLVGARPIDDFRRVIDRELDEARDEIARGTALESYYEQTVLERGKSTI